MATKHSGHPEENADQPDRRAFVVSPIGEDDSPEGLRSANLLEGIIRPELDSRNIGIVRADRLPNAGSIGEVVIRNIVDSNLVVCDLARRDASVFYVLGIAEALRTPLVILADEERLPFRVADSRAVRVPDQDGKIDAFDIRNCRECFGRAVDTVLEEGHDPDTPVSRAAERVAALNTLAADAGDSDSMGSKRRRGQDRRERWTREPRPG
jgi:hypothetical protein